MRISPMLRSIDMLLVLALIAVVVWTFKVKHDSQTALERVSELERQIAAEKTEIDLLKSDWSLLTSPARLQELVKRYEDELGLETMQPAQMTDEQNLPTAKEDEIPVIEPASDGFAGIDTQITTGSIPVPQLRSQPKSAE